jgi:polyphosphate kinase 2 (PPK2 family)
MKERKWQELDKLADELLALMKGAPTETKSAASTFAKRLPPKIQKIQKELPAWIDSDANKKSKATALMRQLQEYLKASNFEEAEKTADSILEMIGANDAAGSGSEGRQPR